MPQPPNNQQPNYYYYYQNQQNGGFQAPQTPKKNNKWPWILLGIAIIVIIVLIYLLSSTTKQQVITVQNAGLITEEAASPMPEIITKTEEVIAAEKKLKVVRKVEAVGDNQIKVSAHIENIDTINEDLILHDISENLKFDRKIELVGGEVKALNGSLFPPNNKINIASYGHRGKNPEKPSKISVVVLDINFTQATEDTSLYEIIFQTETPLSEVSFAAAEIRTGKFIIELDKETISL
jgi:hypothetical protein